MSPEQVAVQEAELSRGKPNDPDPPPKVGAVLVLGDRTLSAHKGELGQGGAHAEYTLLKEKYGDVDATGGTLYTTLEPCTDRRTKPPCVRHVIESGVARVMIGMMDPNPGISGSGIRILRDHGITVGFFTDHEALAELRELNREFIEHQQISVGGFGLRMPERRSVDDWYHAINAIYLDKNFARSIESLYLHLVEQGRSLMLEVEKDDLDPDELCSQLAKIFAWWLGLCANANVRSIEDLVRPRLPGADGLARHARSLGGWIELVRSEDSPDIAAASAQLNATIHDLATPIRHLAVAPGWFLSASGDLFVALLRCADVAQRLAGSTWATAVMEQYPDECFECHAAPCTCPALLPRRVARVAANDESSLTDDTFLLPRDVLAQFNTSATEIAMFGTTFDATGTPARRDVYLVARFVLDELERTSLTDSEQTEVGRVLETMCKLAPTGRMNELVVDRASAVFRQLDPGSRNEVAELVEFASFGAWGGLLRRLLLEPDGWRC